MNSTEQLTAKEYQEQSKKTKQSPIIDKFCLFLRGENIAFEVEYRFDTEKAVKSDRRRFKFDIAIPSLMIAIEFEGINSKKSRHTTLTGYTNDCEKYNLAVKLGWRVLRYTMMNDSNFKKDIMSLI
jgi:hypothetical protein